MDEPILTGRRYFTFVVMQVFYVAMCSVFTTYVILPPFLHYLTQIFRMVLLEKRWDVLVYLLLLASFVGYLFWGNKDSTEAEDLAHPPFLSLHHHPSLSYPWPSYPPASSWPSYYPHASPWPSYYLYPPPYPHFYPDSSFVSDWSYSDPPPTEFPCPVSDHASSSVPPPPSAPSSCPPSSPPSSCPPSSPPSSCPPSSPPSSCPPLSPRSSPQLSLRSVTSSSISLSSPPPPPFRMRAWKVYYQGDYAWLASDVSLSSDSDTDVDIKADRFIAQFRDQLKKDRFKK